METKRILVTGGAGFIASHIVDGYIAAGHHVTVIDNFSTGNRKNLNPKAIFYDCDIRDFDALQKIIEKEKPQIINHHAAQAVVTESAVNPIETYRINATGTLNLLQAAGSSIKKFIFASTGGALYGDLNTRPFTETAPAKPKSLYGITKLLGEQSIAAYACKNGFTYLIFRYANVFGPRQNPHGEAGVVAIFNKLLGERKVPTIFNKNATRDYVYVGDVVVANVLGLTKGENIILNIGNGKQVKNSEVFEMIAREHAYTGEVKQAPARVGEIERSALNASRARRVLGWEPQVSFEQGVKNVHAFKN